MKARAAPPQEDIPQLAQPLTSPIGNTTFLRLERLAPHGNLHAHGEASNHGQ